VLSNVLVAVSEYKMYVGFEVPTAVVLKATGNAEFSLCLTN
jgi:hypothetical protein